VNKIIRLTTLIMALDLLANIVLFALVLGY